MKFDSGGIQALIGRFMAEASVAPDALMERLKSELRDAVVSTCEGFPDFALAFVEFSERVVEAAAGALQLKSEERDELVALVREKLDSLVSEAPSEKDTATDRSK